jgi:type VI protein secretion system component VasK
MLGCVISRLLATRAVTSKQVTVAAGASQTVNFTTTGDAVGKHRVEIAGLVREFEVTKAAKQSQINWWIIGGIIAAIILAPAIWMLMRWRRFSG